MNVLRFIALLVFAFLLLSYASFVWRLFERSTLSVIIANLSSWRPVVFLFLILVMAGVAAFALRDER